MKRTAFAQPLPSLLRAVSGMDDIVLVCKKPYAAYDRLDLLLARIGRAGRIEILSAAWERVLGYSRQELDGRSLFELIPLRRGSARRLIRMLLDETERCPLAFRLTCKGGGHVLLQWYRRFDAYDERVFIAGDPIRPGAAFPMVCDSQSGRRGSSWAHNSAPG